MKELTAQDINALPEPVRKRIHELETICDPSGMVQLIAYLKETVTAQEVRIEELEAASLAFTMDERHWISETLDQRRIDLDQLLVRGGLVNDDYEAYTKEIELAIGVIDTLDDWNTMVSR
jgi:hypothetical protein